jgi:BirA family biotin operon repressor/biotin-[acetyl-CoA-carboxylase] ligase
MSRRTEKPFWDPEELQAQLDTKILGKRLIVFNRVTSTNDFLKRLARRGAEAGTLVLADQQTAGRGRLGRPWQSPPNVGLWLSFILRPELPLERIGALPLAIAVIVAETLSAICGETFSVKWPNDILWQQRKICGILCEAQISPAANSAQLDYVIAGLGINVNQQPHDFHPDWSHRAVSLGMITGHAFDRQKVFLNLVQRLERNLLMNLPPHLPLLLSRWRLLCAELGKPVHLRQTHEMIAGTFEDIGAGGELILRLGNGKRQTFSAGEVSIVK